MIEYTTQETKLIPWKARRKIEKKVLPEYYKGDWYWYSSVCTDLLAEYGKNEIDKIDDAIEITAWMPLPEPWKGEQP